MPCTCIFGYCLYVKQNGGLYQTDDDVFAYNTRARHNSVHAYWRLRRWQNSPGYWAIKLFNVLHHSVKDLSYNFFKLRVKQYLINSDFYSFDE